MICLTWAFKSFIKLDFAFIWRLRGSWWFLQDCRSELFFPWLLIGELQPMIFYAAPSWHCSETSLAWILTWSYLSLSSSPEIALNCCANPLSLQQGYCFVRICMPPNLIPCLNWWSLWVGKPNSTLTASELWCQTMGTLQLPFQVAIVGTLGVAASFFTAIATAITNSGSKPISFLQWTLIDRLNLNYYSWLCCF